MCNSMGKGNGNTMCGHIERKYQDLECSINLPIQWTLYALHVNQFTTDSKRIFKSLSFKNRRRKNSMQLSYQFPVFAGIEGTEIPSIPKIQSMIEDAWSKGIYYYCTVIRCFFFVSTNIANHRALSSKPQNPSEVKTLSATKSRIQESQRTRILETQD